MDSDAKELGHERVADRRAFVQSVVIRSSVGNSHPVSAGQQRRRHFDPERPTSFQIDHRSNLTGLATGASLDWAGLLVASGKSLAHLALPTSVLVGPSS